MHPTESPAVAGSRPKWINDILRGGFQDFRTFINPLIYQRAVLSGEPVRLARAVQGHLELDNGQVVEDFHGTQAFGHRHPSITEAVVQLLQSDSPTWFPARVNPYSGSLAKRLCERANTEGAADTPYDNVFFASSGSEAVEAGLKLARAALRKPRILSLERAYHGCTMGSCGLMTKGVFRDPFEPHIPGLSALPINDVQALSDALASEDVAAVVVEPIQLEGGVRALHPDYIEALGELTQRHHALLIADEVQTGLGRTGRFLASSAWPRKPDVVLLGKHLGGGLMPLSCMMTQTRWFKGAYGRDLEIAEAHNSTFSGNAAATVAGHATLDLLTDELIQRVKRVGTRFRAGLRRRLEGNKLISGISGEGLIAGIHLNEADHPWLTFEHFGMPELNGHPTTGLLLCHRLYKRGYFCFVCGHDWNVLRLQPRFFVPDGVLSAFIEAIAEELEYLTNLT